jgi:hypothetical protein
VKHRSKGGAFFLSGGFKKKPGNEELLPHCNNFVVFLKAIE